MFNCGIMSAIQKAIDAVGTQAELARRLNVTDMAISQWKKRGVPPERCIPIEDATDRAVTRYELRPDVFGSAPVEAS